MRPKIPIPPEVVARIGRENDADIAADTGVSAARLREYRKVHGIESPWSARLSRTKWTPDVVARLGKEPDISVARALGVTQGAVSAYRRILDIPAFAPPRKPGPAPEEIRRARVAAGHTQEQAAQVVYSGLRTWKRWELGEGSMPAAEWALYRLRSGLVTVDDLD